MARDIGGIDVAILWIEVLIAICLIAVEIVMLHIIKKNNENWWRTYWAKNKVMMDKINGLDKRVNVGDIDLKNVTVDDLKFNGDNYREHIHLCSLLENISVCQISDAYKGISHRSGTIKSIKPINNLKVWGSIFTAETTSDDWGTSALAIDAAGYGDILFFKVDNDEKAIWGELASTAAKNN